MTEKNILKDHHKNSTILL